VLWISGDGSLRLVPGGVVSSGGVLPLSVAVHDNLVYVANAGNGVSNYTGFRLRRDGRLTPSAGSTVALPDGSQPGDMLLNANGTKLAGTCIGTSLIDSFTVGDDSRLAAARRDHRHPRHPRPGHLQPCRPAGASRYPPPQPGLAVSTDFSLCPLRAVSASAMPERSHANRTMPNRIVRGEGAFLSSFLGAPIARFWVGGSVLGHTGRWFMDGPGRAGLARDYRHEVGVPCQPRHARRLSSLKAAASRVDRIAPELAAP
jgi:hypothetical protein